MESSNAAMATASAPAYAPSYVAAADTAWQQQQQYLQWQQFQQWQTMQQQQQQQAYLGGVSPPYNASGGPAGYSTPVAPPPPPPQPFGASPQPLYNTQQAPVPQGKPQSTTAGTADTSATSTSAAAPSSTSSSTAKESGGGCDLLGGMTSLTTFLNSFNTNGTNLLASVAASGKQIQQLLSLGRNCGA